MDDACGSGCSTATIQGRYHDGLNAATAATTANFVGIYGMEYGVIGQTADHEGHVALYDVTKLLSWEAYAEVTTSQTDYLSTWTAANNAANPRAEWSRPAPSVTRRRQTTAAMLRTPPALNLIRGVAVISGPAFATTTNFADGGSRYAGPSAGTDMYQFALQRGLEGRTGSPSG